MAKLKPGAWNSIWVFQLLESSSAFSASAHRQEAEWGLEPGHSNRRCRCLRQYSSCAKCSVLNTILTEENQSISQGKTLAKFKEEHYMAKRGWLKMYWAPLQFCISGVTARLARVSERKHIEQWDAWAFQDPPVTNIYHFLITYDFAQHYHHNIYFSII